MDQIFDPRSLKRAAPIVAFALGAIVALIVAILPQWRMEAAIAATGLDHLVAAARPPLGATARSALALASGASVAALVWAVATVAAKIVPARSAAAPAVDLPLLRRADAHPDAPARRPLRASEDLMSPDARPRPIGPVIAPTLVPETAIEPAITRALPADLDTPLAAVDPAAIPDVPREPVRAVPPLARPMVVAADDPVETFALTPVRRAPAIQPAPVATAPRPTSLDALLDRLERGAARRGGPPAPSIEEALGLLKGLAAR